MRLSSVYKSRSHKDPTKESVKVHWIGSEERLLLEMRLGTFSYDDPKLLAVVKGDDMADAREIAKYFADKLHLEMEF